MSDLSHILTSMENLWTASPGKLLPILALACVVTFIIALMRDARCRKGQ